MRIALLTYSTKPRGGVVHTLSLAEALQELGHRVHVFALGSPQGEFFRPLEVDSSLIPHEAPEDAPLDQKIRLYIDAYRQFLQRFDGSFDIYHAQDCISANALWQLRESGKIPWFVRTVHHVDDFVSPYLVQCQEDSIHRPDGIFVVSEFWRKELLRKFAVESHIVYNGVDLSRFCPPSPEQATRARLRVGLESGLALGDDLVFLHIGGIEPRKNSLRLLRAFEKTRAELAEKGRRSVLVLAGGETLFDYRPYRESFFQALEESPLELGRDVLHLGSVEEDLIPSLYHAADVFAFPSLKEGWGLVALEAMASGCTVLASDLPVFREYLVSGDNGWLIDPENIEDLSSALTSLALDKPLRQRLTAAGLETAARFTWQGSAGQLSNHYQELLSRSNAEFS
ncbi:MAG: MSMEG_0565 family glycosyltransferase [Deltaproteobacteria bacterium]|nr:MSMEG_0565 family glycosyltransferase [Deltaproteobacteria bacterium]